MKNNSPSGLLNPLALQARIMAKAKAQSDAVKAAEARQPGSGAKYATTLSKIWDSVGPIAFQTAQASYLRSETSLSSNISQYNFNIIKATDNSDLITEQKLDRNDVFITDTFGLFVYQPLLTERPKFELQTYINTTAFSQMTTGSIQDLQVVYNGYFNLKISQTEIISALDTKRFKYVPDTQQGTVSAAATPIPSSGASPVTEFKVVYSEQNNEAGFAQISPAIVFSGQGSNIITLNIPTFSGIDLAANSGYSNVVVFHPYGLLLKNVASRFI